MFFNNIKTTVNKDITLNNALASFDDYSHQKSNIMADIQHPAIKKLYPKIAKIRIFGDASMDYSFLVLSRPHGTVVITKNIWDITPRIIICLEEDALIRNLDGLPYPLGDDGVIVCSNKELLHLICDSFSISN